jgi:lipopolysaccharide exporter
MALTSAVVSGAAWTITTGIGARIIALAGTVILTYYLTLDVQGEVSNAYIVVATAHWATCGMAPYLTAKPDSGPEVAWNIVFTHMLSGAVIIGLALIGAMIAGPILQSPGMARYAPGFAVVMLLFRFNQLLERVVSRKLDFRTVGIARGASETAYGVFAVITAALGAGGMAIVYGNLARGLVTLSVLWPKAELRSVVKRSPIRWELLKPVFDFALPLAGSGLVTTLTRRWDNLFLSNRFGPAVAGAYNSAYGLADVPAIQVGEQIGDVLLPSFARMKPEERRVAVVHATGLLALVVFPLAFGLGAVADTAVHTLLHPTYWEMVGPMLSVLASMSVTRPINTTIVAPYLEACGQTRPIFTLAMAELVILFGFLFLFGWPNWRFACYAVAGAFVVHAMVSLWLLQRFDGIKVRSLLGEMLPVLVACVPMVAAVLLVRYAFVHAGLKLYGVRLVLEILAGGAAYVGAALLAAKEQSQRLLRFVREMRARVSAP